MAKVLFALLSSLFLMGVTMGVLAQEYTMADVSTLPRIEQLPDPFLKPDGSRIKRRSDWKEQRRLLLKRVLDWEYGQLPPEAHNVSGMDVGSTRRLTEPASVEREILLRMGPGHAVHTHLFLTIPPGKGPFPVIVKGDLCWGRIDPAIVATVISRGYMLAEFDRTEIAPDSAERAGVYAAYPDYQGGRMAAWAWGYQRVIDYLLTLPITDYERVIVTGHSRGGKAALLAGATDERVALTAPNNSGCGGAGCYRVQGESSEDIAAILKNFPFWFHPDLHLFIGEVDRLPIDQNIVRSLVAPRALLSTEGLGDTWANPVGTQESYLAAQQVYAFLGLPDYIGIVYRSGGHEHGARDFSALLDFADKVLFRKEVDRRFDELAFPDAPRAFTWNAPSVPSPHVSPAAAHDATR